MTHIHLAVKDGQLMGQRLGNLPEGTFYMREGRLFRVLAEAQQTRYVTALAMKELEQVYHPMDDMVRSVELKTIKIEVEIE